MHGMTLSARHGSYGPSELTRLDRENHRFATENYHLRVAITHAIEAIQRGSASAPVLESLKAALTAADRAGDQSDDRADSLEGARAENASLAEEVATLFEAIQRIDGINDNPSHFNVEINAVCDRILRPVKQQSDFALGYAVVEEWLRGPARGIEWPPGCIENLSELVGQALKQARAPVDDEASK